MDPTSTIRPANEADISVMTTITTTAYRLDAKWHYHFLELNVYPDDHHHFLHSRQAGHIANSKKGIHTAMLAEAWSEQNPNVEGVITLNVWQLPGPYTNEGGASQKGK